MAVNDIYRINIGTHWDQQAGINVTHWRVSTQVGADLTPAVIATDFSAFFAAPFKGLMHNTATYDGVKVQKIWPPPATVPAVVTADSGVGTTGAAGLPPQTCGLLSLRTALAGRANRGRMYLPFPSEQDNVDATGRPSAGYQAVGFTLGGQMITPRIITVGAQTMTFVPGIYHRVTHNFDPFTSRIMRAVWATQRRRGDFGRPNPFGPF